MRRIIFDVPLWSLYLHRTARGLPRADPSDAIERELEDELFERLYAGEVEPIPEAQRFPPLASWAQRIHDTITHLPAFERLAQDCRGRADEAAMAVEALMNELRPDDADDVLRRSIRAGCGKAVEAVEQLRDALDGLEHVGFGASPPGTPGTGEPARSLAARLRDDARLRRIALLAGRFRRIAGGKRRSRVRHGADEMVDIEQGADMGRLLPLELAQLVHPRTRLLTLRNMVELLCLQYRLEGKETLGKGPLVVAIDKSGSMAEGDKDVWASAVALALLDVAQHEKRPFALLCFDGAVKHESIVAPGAALPEAALFVPADGGTDIDKAVRRGLEIIEQRPGALREADIVLITDGGSDPAGAPELRERAARLGVTVLGVAIDVEPGRLAPWCDEVIAAHDMSRVDERAADALFRR
jgi:Mg-chelatase subunit ChlD